MAYVPVAKRESTSTPTGGYVPVAQRANTKPVTSGVSDFLGLDNKSIFNAPMKTSTPAFTPDQINGQPKEFIPLTIAKSVGQGIASNIASAGITIAHAIDPSVGSLKAEDIHSIFGQELFKNIFGGEEIKSIEDRIVAAEPKVQAWRDQMQQLSSLPNLTPTEKFVTTVLGNLPNKIGGVDTTQALTFSGVMGSVGIDLTPVGGLEKNLFKKFILEGSEGGANALLKSIGIDADLAAHYAPEIVKVKNEAEAKAVFNAIANAQATTKSAAKSAIPQTAAEAATRYSEEVLPALRESGKPVVLGSDTLKEYFGNDFNTARQPVYGQATKRLFEEEVKTNPNPIVRLTAGGPASGKTDFIMGDITRNFNGVIYESTLSDYKTALDRINTVKAAGKNVEIYGVIPNVEEARYYSLKRAAAIGRDIPEDYFIKAHVGALETTKRLLEEGVVDAKQVKLVDARGANATDLIKKLAGEEKYVQDPLAILKETGYNEANVADATARGQGKFEREMATRGSRESLSVQGGVGGAEIKAGRESNVSSGGRGVLRGEEKLPTYQQLYELEHRAQRGTTQEELDNLRLQQGFYSDAIEQMPGKKLMKYVSQSTGELPEITGKAKRGAMSGGNKQVKNSLFGEKGDQIIQEIFGAENNPDWAMAQKAVDDYRDLRKQLDNISADIIDKQKNITSERKIERISAAAMSERRTRLRVLEDRYNLTNKDIAIIRGRRDLSAMTRKEFETFMERAEVMAAEEERRREALVQLKGTIYEKELLKTDNLREAMSLPPISQMTEKELRLFDDTLQQFKHGDEFLSVRKLETVDNTDLAGIKTVREAQERLLTEINAERLVNGQKPYTLSDLQEIKVAELDRFLYDKALADRNPFYNMMVAEKTKAVLNANAGYLEVRDRVEELIKAARASRSRPLIDRLAPQDKKIFDWLEADELGKWKQAKEMTPEELEAAGYIRDRYIEARDYLVQQQVLKKYQRDYITHIRRGFLEAWRDDGLMTAFQEVFKQYKLDEAVFNILDQKTGEILPLEKFFKFSMHRTGELVPSKNVAKAVEQYFGAFEKKKALDSLIPKIDIYAQMLTPKHLTPRGLEFDDSLKRFVNEWLNTKKGRPSSQFGVKPGGKIDWALRTGVAFTRLLDLGFSIPVGLASNVGEETANFISLGAKNYATGVARLATSKGRQITAKYENFVGEPILKNLIKASEGAGDAIGKSAFILFSTATRRANQIYLLGSMSKAEYEAGAITAERLTKIQMKMSKYRVTENAESIFGKTAPGAVATQYKKWAVPLLHSTLHNISTLKRVIKNRGFADAMEREDTRELLRSVLLLGTLGFGTYGIIQAHNGKSMKDMSFSEQIAYKAAQDSLSLIGALDPKFLSGEPRLMSFIGTIGTAASQIIQVQKNKDGELTGVKGLQTALTPALVRQVEKDLSGGSDTSSSKKATPPKIPGLPDLPTPKSSLPPLPKLPSL